MATILPNNPFKDAATAEGLTAAQARAVRDALPDAASLKAWVKGLPAGGADEAAVRTAWPGLKDLSDAQVRAAMRAASDIAGGEYQE